MTVQVTSREILRFSARDMLPGVLVNGEYRVSVNEVEHWVRVDGAEHAGVPIVLIHGGPGGNAHMLESSIGPHLATRRTVVIYEQRGCGRSGRPVQPDTYHLAQLVEDLDGLRDVLGLEQIVAAGFSFGGLVAAEYALAHRDRVVRLVLGAPPIAGPLHCPNRLAAIDAIADDEFRAKLRGVASGLDHKPAGLDFAEIMPLWQAVPTETRQHLSLADPANLALVTPTPEAVVPADPAFAAGIWATKRPVSLLDDLAQLHTPTLVTVGLFDRHVGVDACREVVDRMPDARLGLLDRSAHNTWEQPELYASLIADFAG